MIRRMKMIWSWAGGLAAIAILFAACSGGTALESPGAQRPGADVHAMRMLAADAGWALTDQGLQRTADGGQTWQAITPAKVQPADIRGAFFSDGKTGWVIASEPADSGGAISLVSWRTNDGGSTWASSQVAGPNPDLADSRSGPAYIDFVDKSNGWALGAGEACLQQQLQPGRSLPDN